MTKFTDELEEIINKNSIENGSDTPDFILAEFLKECLGAWERATIRRDDWYKGVNKRPTKTTLVSKGETMTPNPSTSAEITKYYKQKLVNGPLTVEYSSEDDSIIITIEHKLKMGATIGYDYMKIDPTAIKPLIAMLEALALQPDEPNRSKER